PRLLVSTLAVTVLPRARRHLGLGQRELDRDVQHREPAQDRLVQVHLALDFSDRGPRGLVQHPHVDAVALLVDLVGHAALAPALTLEHLAASRRDPLLNLLDFLVHPVVVEPRVEDERGFVLRHSSFTSSVVFALNRFIARSMPSKSQHSTASAARCNEASSASSSSGRGGASTCSRYAAADVAAPTPTRRRG